LKQFPERSGSAGSADGVAGALRLSVAATGGFPPPFLHASRLLDRFGMVQFARGATPDLDFGYCLDDNARAFLTAILALHLDPGQERAKTLGEAGLRLMELCRRPDGRFHNLVAADGSFTDEVGSQESLGRTIWACGVAAACSPIADWRERALALLEAALQHPSDLVELRPKAYAILGLAALVAPERASLIPEALDRANAADPVERSNLFDRQRRSARMGSLDPLSALKELCWALALKFEEYADEQWQWWEQKLTWGNARLPEALLRGAAALDDARLEELGMRALGFLASLTHEREMFVPIGNNGWYERGGPRPLYDQQPIEACCMVDMWLAAAKSNGQLTYRSKALEAFLWFSGLNTEKLAVVDAQTGGCRDGLCRGGLNMNMGAESTLSYLHAHCALAAAFSRENVAADV
jgi:hypothetical protein